MGYWKQIGLSAIQNKKFCKSWFKNVYLYDYQNLHINKLKKQGLFPSSLTKIKKFIIR